MTTRPRARTRGFTLTEMAVVVAIVGIVAALAYDSLERHLPRAHIANTATELQSLLHGARQTALAGGRDVLVMVFPNCPNPEGTGRVVVYQNGDPAFFTDAGTPNFAGYDCTVLAAGAASEVLSTLDFPRSVRVGPANGLGLSRRLAAPYDRIDVTRDCAFCNGDGTSRRGAIRFDSRGRAWFHDRNGAAMAAPAGSSFSITSAEIGGTRALVIQASTGSVLAVNEG
jgi:prepilin-type N-terminal cleavage/methylation domain-containing protein